MKRQFAVVFVLMTTTAGLAWADQDLPSTAKELLEIAQSFKDSVVQVEMTLQYDKGAEPQSSGWTNRCPNCGRHHGVRLESLVRQERPHEAAGYVLSPTEVITADPLMHPRFIKSIQVRFGDQLIEAKPAAYAIEQNAMVLVLAEPLVGAKPLTFDAKRTSPYLAVTYDQLNGDWTLSVKGVSDIVSTTRGGRDFVAVPSYCLLVDADGVPVGMSMKDELSVDDAWKGSPLDWPAISGEQMAESLERIRQAAGMGVLRVKLNFRSPKKQAGSRYRRQYDGDDDGGATEKNVLGVLIDAQRLLVIAKLDPKVTARLERLVVFPPDAEPVTAKFAHTLKDYGAFIATVETPLEGPLEACTEPIDTFRTQLLMSMRVKLEGQTMIPYFWHERIVSFDIGWKGRIFPVTGRYGGNLLLFEPDGKLVAFTVGRRENIAVRKRWRDNKGLTPAVHLFQLLPELDQHVDLSNVPLAEAEENRLAWLGVELQPLDRELARANKVSDQTNDGRTGAMVSFVYADSPAGQSGIEVGDILLRLHVADIPKPIEVELKRDRQFPGGAFPWDRLDEVPEQYLEMIPNPWPNVENSLTRALTDLGFGRQFTAELFRNGELLRKDFVVTEGPPHYGSAAKYKDKQLGLTVRDMSYEVRRYFQKGPDEPGVIVSRIEPGSKASVAGIKPYEIITHVNDEPAMTAEDFERLIEGHSELRFEIKRMNRGRVVKIKQATPGADKPPTTQPAPTTRPAE